MCKHKVWNGLGTMMLLTFLAVCIASPGLTDVSIASSESPTPTPDRLAEPPLPSNPTQYEQGRHVYWLNCMPCHGDMGQGLTDEFRGLWVEDHQDCWESGCHGGRMEDQGFPLPRTIPAVIFSSSSMPLLATEKGLFEYLRATHPPQRPGKLAEDEYWAVTAFILTENKRLPPGQEVGPQAAAPPPGLTWKFAATGAALLLMSTTIVWLFRRHKSPVSLND